MISAPIIRPFSLAEYVRIRGDEAAAMTSDSMQERGFSGIPYCAQLTF